MVEVEILITAVSLAIVAVVFGFVSIAYYRTRIHRLLVPLLLAALLGASMVVEIAEEVLEEGVPYIGALTSVLLFGIALLLLITVVRQFSWEPR